MIIGVPKEIKVQEFRVGLTPAGVQGLTAIGHQVYVQKSAGEGSGLSDAQYQAAGATLLATAAE
jgi:alanine dehydrogenase